MGQMRASALETVGNSTYSKLLVCCIVGILVVLAGLSSMGPQQRRGHSYTDLDLTDVM